MGIHELFGEVQTKFQTKRLVKIFHLSFFIICLS
jgi:hypothetical protein